MPQYKFAPRMASIRMPCRPPVLCHIQTDYYESCKSGQAHTVHWLVLCILDKAQPLHRQVQFQSLSSSMSTLIRT